MDAILIRSLSTYLTLLTVMEGAGIRWEVLAGWHGLERHLSLTRSVLTDVAGPSFIAFTQAIYLEQHQSSDIHCSYQARCE